MKEHKFYDVIVIGSGMGGLSAATLLAKSGRKVLVLEAAHAPGGCSSSYYRKGAIFESGATTLIGFDEHQPLQILERKLGITINKTEIDPGMTVHLQGKELIRHKDRNRWIQQAGEHFGNKEGQQSFWNTCFHISDTVWKVSEKNTFFPPASASEWIQLAINNNPQDALILRYGFMSVRDVMKHHNVDSPEFLKFVDEQLMITAQSTADETPALMGAAGLTYTNYNNYYVPGGMIEMVHQLTDTLEKHGSTIQNKSKVISLRETGGSYIVETEKSGIFTAPVVVSNIPVWNLPDITIGRMQTYFKRESAKYDKAWGAFTMGIVTEDAYPDDITLHHQIHLDEPLVHTGAQSLFVSFSARGDEKRAKPGQRVLALSCHTETSLWFTSEAKYERMKQETQDRIMEVLREKLPGFKQSENVLAFSSTPFSWQSWVNRKKGRVGGIPQSMNRSLLDWTPSQTPFKGLYLTGDTVYPGQGIPGVTLGGINVYYRIQKNH